MMSRSSESFRSYVVALLILFMLSVFAGYRGQIEIVENSSTPEFNSSSEESEPWESPLQELLRIAESCANKIPGFVQIAKNAQIEWQHCMDSINPSLSSLESRKEMNDSATTQGTIPEIPICSNTTAFKGCWLSVIAALNECEQGVGDVVGAIYFALYDDTCRDGGRFTIENRRKVAEEGEPCSRNYFTEECDVNKMLRDSNDLCLRFNLITACDLSSIDPNCSNQFDKKLHSNIFNRVGHKLQCNSSPESNEGVDLLTGHFPMYIVFALTVVQSFYGK